MTDQLFRQKGTFQERKSSSDIRHSGNLNNCTIIVTFLFSICFNQFFLLLFYFIIFYFILFYFKICDYFSEIFTLKSIYYHLCFMFH